jgi:hypothetical protein
MVTLGKDPKAVVRKLRDREDAIKSDKGISAEVALYTQSGGLSSSGKNKKATGNKGKPKANKDRTCHICKKSGHFKYNCPDKEKGSSWNQSGKASKDSDKKEAPKNVAAVATTTETLWMTVAGPGPVDVDDSAELEQAY